MIFPGNHLVRMQASMEINNSILRGKWCDTWYSQTGGCEGLGTYLSPVKGSIIKLESIICKKVFPWSILRGGEPDLPCILRQLFLTGSHQKPLLEGRPRRGAPLWVSRGWPGGSQPQQSPCILSCLCRLLFTPDPALPAQPQFKSQIRRTAEQTGAPVSLEIYYLTTNEENGGIFIRGLWGFSIIVLPWTRASWQGLWSTVSVVFLCSAPVFFCSHFLLYLSTYCSLSLIYCCQRSTCT